MKYFRNKKIWLFGGTQGIGLAMANDISQVTDGLKIFARNEDRLAATGKKLGSGTCQLDITDEATVKNKLEGLIKDEGCPDIVINCAGFSHPGYFTETPIKAMRSMMEVNYFGTVNVLKPVVPHMIKRRSGHLVTTSSLAGFMGLFGYSSYCATKFAVLGFSEALKRELAPFDLKVSVICPPGTQTPGFEEENKIKPAEVLEMEKSAKILTAEEVAQQSLQQIAKGKFMILPSFDSRMAFGLNRFFPAIIEQIVKRKTKKKNAASK